MKRKNIKKTKKNNNSNLMLFQKATTKFTRDCPLSGKDAPVINYKNLKEVIYLVKRKFCASYRCRLRKNRRMSGLKLKMTAVIRVICFWVTLFLSD
mgnify:CR=1 FL=1